MSYPGNGYYSSNDVASSNLSKPKYFNDTFTPEYCTSNPYYRTVFYFSVYYISTFSPIPLVQSLLYIIDMARKVFWRALE